MKDQFRYHFFFYSIFFFFFCPNFFNEFFFFFFFCPINFYFFMLFFPFPFVTLFYCHFFGPFYLDCAHDFVVSPQVKNHAIFLALWSLFLQESGGKKKNLFFHLQTNRARYKCVTPVTQSYNRCASFAIEFRS